MGSGLLQYIMSGRNQQTIRPISHLDMKIRHPTYDFNTIDNAYAQEGPEEQNSVYELEGVSGVSCFFQEPIDVEENCAPVVLVVKLALASKDCNQLIERTLPRGGSGYSNKLRMDATQGTYKYSLLQSVEGPTKASV